jgi:hypothetical protein
MLVSNTTLTWQWGVKGTISDYVLYTVPMVPSLIVHCVNEVDLHGLNDEVYKISDAKKDVTEPPWHRPSWEANSHVAIQETPCLLWNLKVH